MSAALGFSQIAGLILSIKGANNAGDAFEAGKQLASAVDEKTKGAQKFAKDYIAASMGGKSLIRLSKQLMVEPRFILSSELKTTPETEDAIKLVINIFSAYFMQAFHVMAEIDTVKPKDALRLLNPSYECEYNGLTLESLQMQTEASYAFLPINGNSESEAIADHIITEESLKCLELSEEAGYGFAGKMKSPKRGKKNKKDKEDNDKDKKKKVKTGSSMTIKDIEKMPIIHLGKTLDISLTVETTSGESKKLKFPMLIRSSIQYVNYNVIKEVFAFKGKSRRFLMRWNDWKAGKIKFWKDLVFASDLIKEHKKSIMFKDEADVLIKTLKNSNDAMGTPLGKKGLLGKNGVGYGTLYNAFFISEDEAKDIEYELGGPLTKLKIRNEFFRSSMAMFLVVIDREWERCVIYTRDLDGYTDTSFKGLGNAANKSDYNILDIFKNLSGGNQPVF